MIIISADKKEETYVGIVDADLLDSGTRHPNLALMKIAGFLKQNKIPYRLIEDSKEDTSVYSHIFISRVFTFTKLPIFLESNKSSKIYTGGTGFYANESDPIIFNKQQYADLHSLERNELLKGFNYAKQMPDYTLYDSFIAEKIKQGKKPKYFKDYNFYSIGFLTRGCIRRCSFCVNKNMTRVDRYSDLADFMDPTRPMIYLWDDNILASPSWKECLTELKLTKKPFQFRQGLDIRLMTPEKAEFLATVKYHGDFIFAFDQIKDKKVIERKLALWKSHVKKTTKLYLFCGYQVSDDESLFKDVIEIFERIEILMKYGCLGYIMRHEDYKNHELSNIYVQIARWCNQPQFYKKMSFKEFIERNQFYTLKGTCKCKRTFDKFMDYYSEHKEKLEFYFNLKFDDLNQFKGKKNQHQKI